MANEFDDFESEGSLLAYTVEIVTAHIGNTSVAMADVPAFIQSVHAALAGLSGPAEEEEPAVVPIVPVRQSVKHDYIICLECGKKMKMLKAHIRAVHGLDPHDYRAKYGLPRDYPMVAAAQKEMLTTRAQNLGLSARMQAAREAKAAKRHLRPVKTTSK